MVDVIEIDDSDEETAIVPKSENRENCNHKSNLVATESQDEKPQVTQQQQRQQNNNIKSESQQPSNDLQESRRKKIDQLLDVYIKYHHRLISVEYLMSAEQLLRWQSHLATSYGSLSSVSYQTRRATASQNAERRSETTSAAAPPPPVYDHQQPGPSTSAFGFNRPAWFIDSPPAEVGSTSRATYRRTAAPRARRAPRRKRRYTSTTSRSKTKRPKRTTATWAAESTVSRKPRSNTTTTTSTTTRPKASTSKTQVERKPKVTKLQALLAKVKKER